MYSLVQLPPALVTRTPVLLPPTRKQQQQYPGYGSPQGPIPGRGNTPPPPAATSQYGGAPLGAAPLGAAGYRSAPGGGSQPPPPQHPSPAQHRPAPPGTGTPSGFGGSPAAFGAPPSNGARTGAGVPPPPMTAPPMGGGRQQQFVQPGVGDSGGAPPPGAPASTGRGAQFFSVGGQGGVAQTPTPLQVCLC